MASVRRESLFTSVSGWAALGAGLACGAWGVTSTDLWAVVIVYGTVGAAAWVWLFHSVLASRRPVAVATDDASLPRRQAAPITILVAVGLPLAAAGVIMGISLAAGNGGSGAGTSVGILVGTGILQLIEWRTCREAERRAGGTIWVDSGAAWTPAQAEGRRSYLLG